MKYDENYYLNFSPRMQRNLIEAGFVHIDEQVHIKTQRTFYVYEKDYDLQVFLGLFKVNKEKLNNFYEECQLIKAFKEFRIPANISIEDCDIKENKFTKLEEILAE